MEQNPIVNWWESSRKTWIGHSTIHRHLRVIGKDRLGFQVERCCSIRIKLGHMQRGWPSKGWNGAIRKWRPIYHIRWRMLHVIITYSPAFKIISVKKYKPWKWDPDDSGEEILFFFFFCMDNEFWKLDPASLPDKWTSVNFLLKYHLAYLNFVEKMCKNKEIQHPVWMYVFKCIYC